MPKRRNPVAAAPILRKGGAHIRSRSAERAAGRRRLRQTLADCLQPGEANANGSTPLDEMHKHGYKESDFL